jgi:glycosyltransferase involved in cell wall biosynthesis
MQIAFIISTAFWSRDRGRSERLYSMLAYLQQRADVTVYYYGFNPSNDIVKTLFPLMRISLYDSHTYTVAQFTRIIENNFIKRKADICILEHIDLSYLLDAIPKGTTTVLDVYNLKSKRESFLRSFGIRLRPFSWTDETIIMNQFNKILAACETDYKTISEAVGKSKTVLISHAPQLRKSEIRKEVKNIGFIGSATPFNKEALSWFLEHVFPLMKHSNVTINIYGNVKLAIKYHTPGSLAFHGFVKNQSDIYSSQDIIINPAPYSCGISIQNIEAMGCGLPLVTSEAGAAGMKTAIKREALLVGKTAQEFAAALDLLIEDFDLRMKIGSEAHRYALEFNTDDACYSQLLNAKQKSKK